MARRDAVVEPRQHRCDDHRSLIVGTASVDASTANDAIALAINGNVIVTYSGQAHTYTFNPTLTTGTGAAFRIVGTGSTGSTTELQLEDLADMPGATPDYDYNDYTWSLNVTQTAANGDPLPEVGIEAIDPTAAEAKSPPGTSTGLCPSRIESGETSQRFRRS